MNDIKELREHMDGQVQDIRADIKTAMELINKVGDRTSALELEDARRKGAESVAKGGSTNWGKIIVAIVGVLGSAIALATILAQAVLNSGGQ